MRYSGLHSQFFRTIAAHGHLVTSHVSTNYISQTDWKCGETGSVARPAKNRPSRRLRVFPRPAEKAWLVSEGSGRLFCCHPTSFRTCSRDLVVSPVIVAWKSPKETSRDGLSTYYLFTGHYTKVEWSMFVRNNICNGWTYELQSNAGEFDSVVSSFNSHLSASAKGSLIVNSFLHHHFGGSLSQRGRDFKHQGLEKHIRKRTSKLQIALFKFVPFFWIPTFVSSRKWISFWLI